MSNVSMFATDRKSGMDRQIFLVKFGNFSVLVSNEYYDDWNAFDLLEGNGFIAWLIHNIWYKDFELNFHPSDKGLCLIREEFKSFKNGHWKVKKNT